jgi:hypothetical protein
MASNPYCEALGMRVPAFEAVTGHAEASTYRLLIVALLEKGRPMTLSEVAERFAQAGVAPADAALASLKRCRPARPPVYRDGDYYTLDPHDDDLDLLVFILGLRPPRGPAHLPEAKEAEVAAPLPGSDVPLSPDELAEAWRDASLYSWSPQRVAICILDAHRRPMAPAEALAFVNGVTGMHLIRDTDRRWGRPTAIQVLDDGRWSLEPGHPWLPPARKAVRDRLALVRKWAAMRPDPVVVQANQRAAEERREKHADELARLRRVVVHAFTAREPQAIVLLDVATRALTTLTAEDMPRVHKLLGAYDVIAALHVRPLLKALGYDPGPRHLAELGPPQKTKKLNQRGRTLRITTPLLVWGTCGIGRPFGDEERLRRYLTAGQTARFQRRLEADAKALFALYQYGRLHGAVRLRWGFLDESIPVPWVHPDETRLYGLKRHARDLEVPLEIVAGSAPGWEDPWARAVRCRVLPHGQWNLDLVDETGRVIHDPDVQLARLFVSVH